MNTNDLPDPNWYADTRATTHMTTDPGNLLSCSLYKGNDKFLSEMAHDLAYLMPVILPSSPSNICLNNVLIVPKIKKNLLSIIQLTNDDSCFVEFSSSHLKIKEKRAGKILATRSSTGGLYSLDLTNQHASALFAKSSKKATEDIWHARLGHPKSKILRLLHNNSLVDVNVWLKDHLFVKVAN